MIQSYPKETKKPQRPKTLKDALKNFIESAKNKEQTQGVIVKISPSDEALWSALRDLAGVEKDKKATKEV